MVGGGVVGGGVVGGGVAGGGVVGGGVVGGGVVGGGVVGGGVAGGGVVGDRVVGGCNFIGFIEPSVVGGWQVELQRNQWHFMEERQSASGDGVAVLLIARCCPHSH